MKSTRLVFISITNLLLFHTQLVLGSPDSTYFMVHEQTGLAECENNLSSSPESDSAGVEPGIRCQAANSKGVMECSRMLEFIAQPAQSLSINLDGGTEGRASLVRAKPALDSLKPDGADDIAGNTSSEYQASPIQTPSIVEAFYSRNQSMLQDWRVGYDNSLFVRLDQPGFISYYFYILRARNLIIP